MDGEHESLKGTLFDNVRRCAGFLRLSYAKKDWREGVVIGYDKRFSCGEFCDCIGRSHAGQRN